MEYRQSGKSDLRLSVIGLGCWAFGGGDYWGKQDQKDVNDVVHAAIDHGINYFDTAEAYNEGRSESSLGVALEGIARDKIILGSKIWPMNCYPGKLEKHCEESLKRLNTDYIDLYMIHWPIHLHAISRFTTDEKILNNPPQINQVFDILTKLKESGKIRHIGLSNFSKSRLEKDLSPSVSIGANQLPYNLLSRAIEFDTIDACQEKGIGIISYMTLMQGILTGKYKSLREVSEWQRRTRHFDSAGTPKCRHGEPGFEAEIENIIAALRTLAEETHISMSHLATKWTIANPNITCALVGARNLKQIFDNVSAVQTPLENAVLVRLNQITEKLKTLMGNHLDYYESVANDRTL